MSLISAELARKHHNESHQPRPDVGTVSSALSNGNLLTITDILPDSCRACSEPERLLVRAVFGQPFPMRLQSSRLVAIWKSTGEIVCDGVANDEGEGFTLPVESLIPVPETQSTSHLTAQRNAFRRRDARQQRR
jgi:hypothetical protein